MLDYNNFVANINAAGIVIPAQGKVRAGYFKGFDVLVDQLGGDARRILEQQGMDPRTFDDPDADIECLAAVDLLEHASRHLNNPLFGLQLAEQQDPDVFGCVMALARSAPNLGQALQCLVDYVPVSASPECELELVNTRQMVEFRWRAPNGLSDHEQVSYHGMVLIMKTLKMLGGEQFRPRYASLTVPIGRAESRLLEQRLGCRVCGGAAANAIAFPAELLDAPVATANRTLFSLLNNGLTQLRAVSKAGFIEQVEANVRRGVMEGNCALDDCARRMGTSARTLQKRLTKAGIKFTDLVQNERIKLAKHSLRWSDASLDDIALQLGYAEQTSFGRAFKRATGLTPKEFRLQRDA